LLEQPVKNSTKLVQYKVIVATKPKRWPSLLPSPQMLLELATTKKTHPCCEEAIGKFHQPQQKDMESNERMNRQKHWFKITYSNSEVYHNIIGF
jgi:hypothetical protein